MADGYGILKTMRLFYALVPPDAMIDALQPLLHGVEGARWQAPRQLHITLRYVGEVSARIADELADGLPLHVSSLPPIGLSGVGFFETRGHPNALWARADPREPLTHLHRKLDRACQAMGLEPERRAYVPHMTVARLSRNAGPVEPWLESHAGLVIPPMPFARCSLMESLSTDEGSHYEELAWVSLR